MIVTLDLEIEKMVEDVGGWDAAREGKAGLSVCCTSTINGKPAPGKLIQPGGAQHELRSLYLHEP